MVIIGTIISALSSFILCMPGEWFASIAEINYVNSSLKWFLGIDASGELHPWYIPLLLFVVLFTIGEGIWSPRLMEYTASIAPKKRVGSYMSLSILPWFASKPLVALLQTWILPNYAPKDGPINPFMFWFIIALSALATPILILMFQKLIRKTTESVDSSEDDSDNKSIKEPTEETA